MKNIKIKKTSIYVFIIPFTIITAIFILIALTMTSSVKNYFYEMKKEEAIKLAKSMSVDLSMSGEMSDVANKLLDDRLLFALKGLGLQTEEYSEEFIVALADTFEVDEIYYYNQEGIVEYSSSGIYLGWQAYEGHPVYEFLNSKEQILVEDIRKDTEREVYYKYGYIKNPDGSFLQVGILAEKIQSLLNSFKIQPHLENRIIDDSIIKLFALDGRYKVTASSNKDLIGTTVTNPFTLDHKPNNGYYENLYSINGEEVYEIYVPLRYETEMIDTLGVQFSMNDILPIIRNNTIIAAIGLLIIYLSLLFAMYLSYNRNKKLVQIAFFDRSTGLPNAELLKQNLNESINKNDKEKAIIMIKYEEIGYVNLTYGYEFGDLLLKELGKRLNQLQAPNAQLYRFTAEKFVFYMEDYENNERLIKFLEETKKLLQQPLKVNNVSKNIVTKIGVVKNDDTFKRSDNLLKNATIALNYVDASEDTGYSFYDEKMELKIQREEIIGNEIKDFLSGESKSSIFLVYQPIIDTKTKKVVEFEALARMNSEQFGFVSPVEFIDIAEKNQLIIPLSNHILREACSYVYELIQLGFLDIRIAVNISTIHLLQEDFVSTVFNIIDDTGISGKNLNLEMTESMLIENLELVNDRLGELRDHDIEISLDDFGTGYSSFGRLSELNVDVLKIDKLFIDNLSDESRGGHITKDIISIAHKLGLKTVAEGVECLEQKNYLSQYNCDKLQGYIFSKPVPKDEAKELLQKYNKN